MSGMFFWDTVYLLMPGRSGG